MKLGFLTYLMIGSSFCGFIECRRPFFFDFKNVECTSNPKYISLFECRLSKANNSTSSIAMDIVVVKDVLNITYDILITLPHTRQDVILINATQIDGCKFLQNKSSFRIVQIIRKEFQKYSNMPNKCPVKKKTSMQVRDFKLDPEVFPNYVPATKFNVYFRMYEAGEMLLNFIVNGTCEHTRKSFKLLF